MARQDVIMGSRTKDLTSFQRMQIKRARRVLKAGPGPHLGMQKPEAREILRDHAKMTEDDILRIEGRAMKQYIIFGWDGERIPALGTEQARAKAEKYLRQWRQAGDKIMIWFDEVPGSFQEEVLTVFDAHNNMTDAHAKIRLESEVPA